MEFEKLGDERAKAHETDEGGDRRENIENIDLVRGESEIFSNRKQMSVFLGIVLN